jgi:hypothetical protein
MPGVWETFQEIALITRNITDLKDRIDNTERFLRQMDERLRSVEVDVGGLRQARETMREAARAEIALAVAELRVRYEQERPRPPAPELEG